MASIQFDGTEILTSAYIPQFMKHETVADRDLMLIQLAREDGNILVNERYGQKTITLKGTLTAASQAALDDAIDAFKELFSRPQKNLDISWGATLGTLRFVATCKEHSFDRDYYNIAAVPWTATFIIPSGVGKDTVTTNALNAAASSTDRPVVATRATGATTAVDTTTHVITMPSGILPGDTLLVIFSSDGVPTCTEASGLWTKLGQTSDGTSAVTGAIFWKIATGSDTLTITTSAAEQSTHVSLRIQGGGTPTGTATSGNSTNSDPTAHTVTVGLNDIDLWLATRHGDAQVVATVAPAAYSNLQTSTAAGANGASTNSAERLLNPNPSTNENPGAFTSATEQWVCYTIQVPPRSSFIWDTDQQFTFIGSKTPQPVITLTISTADALMHGIQYTNVDTGERMVITRAADWTTAGRSVVIDFANKKVTDNLSAGGAQVEGKFYGVFPTFKIGVNNVRIQTGGIVNQATSDYAAKIPTPSSGFLGMYIATSNTYFGQSFTVPYAEDTFSGIVVGLNKGGTPGNFFWRIVPSKDQSGDQVPDYGASSIASGTVATALIPDTSGAAYIYCSAGGLFSLAPNTLYWIVGGAQSADNLNLYTVLGNASSVFQYTGGTNGKQTNTGNGGSNWNVFTDFNFSFRLIMGGDPKLTTFTHTVAYNKTYL